ncbi:MAG: hypothetical protein ACKO3T_24495 [Planctomycetaceae bacterium]|jgi:hypothetical protein
MCCESERRLTAGGIWRGRCRLGAALVLVAVVWCGLLPVLSRTAGMRQRIEFLESRGINPSAKFFTEQEAGWRNAAEVERRIRQHPEAFWDLPF